MLRLTIYLVILWIPTAYAANVLAYTPNLQKIHSIKVLLRTKILYVRLEGMSFKLMVVGDTDIYAIRYVPYEGIIEVEIRHH